MPRILVGTTDDPRGRRLVVDYEGGRLEVGAFQAVHCRPGEWVRYSSPGPEGADL